MRTPPPQPGHREQPDALSRRLALLGDELAWLRPDVQDRDVHGRPASASRPGAPGERASSPAGESARPWWDEHTRVTDRRRLDPVSPAHQDPDRADDPAETGGSPPGRHAARRAAPAEVSPGTPPWAATASVGTRARLLLGPAQLTVVALVVVLALGVTCWWLARGRPETTVALQAAPAAGLTPAPTAATGDAGDAGATVAVADRSTSAETSGQTPSSAGAAAGSATASATVTVDVSGKVRRPGVQTLATGARIADALSAAGGAKPGVDLTALNLAQVLVDGQQILVGVAADSGSSSVSGGTGVVGSTGTGGSSAATAATSSGPVQVVDLNTATADQLDSLPEVGPVTAQSILSWRDAHGGFSSVDELLEVDGIGEVTLGKLAPYVTV